MERTIWSCWFQGQDSAPPLVRRCLASWATRNPGWDLRVLDRASFEQFVQLPDLTGKRLSLASLSDLLRAHLLGRFGGIWVDATLYCNRRLEDWLQPVCGQGFFAFARPGPDRELASWFLAAEPDNRLIGEWLNAARHYWVQRRETDDYFWFHHLFGELCRRDPEFARAWQQVPKWSAHGPHAMQELGLTSSAGLVDPRIDWSSPVFKLSHHLGPGDYRPGTLIWELLESGGHA
jgi:hypothetical protein